MAIFIIIVRHLPTLLIKCTVPNSNVPCRETARDMPLTNSGEVGIYSKQSHLVCFAVRVLCTRSQPDRATQADW